MQTLNDPRLFPVLTEAQIGHLHGVEERVPNGAVLIAEGQQDYDFFVVLVGTSSKIENYLGFPTGISGQELADRALLQAQKFGAQQAADLRRGGRAERLPQARGHGRRRGVGRGAVPPPGARRPRLRGEEAPGAVPRRRDR